MDKIQFFRTIERTLRPVFEECFTAETFKTGNTLLVVGVVSRLQAVGADLGRVSLMDWY